VAFETVGEVSAVEVIAVGRKIRQLDDLRQRHGKGHWRKLKGTATVRLASGELWIAEVRWYEAHGIGRRRLKIKQFLD
jgi:hypothetical protein